MSLQNYFWLFPDSAMLHSLTHTCTYCKVQHYDMRSVSTKKYIVRRRLRLRQYLLSNFSLFHLFYLFYIFSRSFAIIKSVQSDVRTIFCNVIAETPNTIRTLGSHKKEVDFHKCVGKLGTAITWTFCAENTGEQKKERACSEISFLGKKESSLLRHCNCQHCTLLLLSSDEAPI